MPPRSEANEEGGMLGEDLRKRMANEIDKNDQSEAQVRAVCYILKEALGLPVESIQDHLIELLPPEVLFTHECFVNYRIFSLVREVLSAIEVDVLQG